MNDCILMVAFRKLPENEQNNVMVLLRKLLMWRGHHVQGMERHLAVEIAGIFAKHGMEIEEYT